VDVLNRTISKLDQSSSIEDLRDLFSSAVKELGYSGFDAFSMKSGTASNADQEFNLFICDYGIDLPGSYVRDGWLQMDPVIAEIARTTTPFEYVNFLKTAQNNASVKWQLGAAQLRGVERAWCVPLSIVGYVRGMTIYMQGTDESAENLFLETRSEIHLMCVQFMEAFIRLYNVPPEDVSDESGLNPDTISQRETDCLHWAARGKTNWEIGQILKISENTVRYHLKKVFVKLGANSRSSAVTIAARAGIIEI